MCFAPHVLCTSCALHLMCFAPHVLCISCASHLMCFAPVLCTCTLHLQAAPLSLCKRHGRTQLHSRACRCGCSGTGPCRRGRAVATRNGLRRTGTTRTAATRNDLLRRRRRRWWWRRRRRRRRRGGDRGRGGGQGGQERHPPGPLRAGPPLLNRPGPGPARPGAGPGPLLNRGAVTAVGVCVVPSLCRRRSVPCVCVVCVCAVCVPCVCAVCVCAVCARAGARRDDTARAVSLPAPTGGL
jgi:hypothetical protein